MKKVLVLATCMVLLLAGAVQAATLTLGSHVTWINSTMDGTNVTVGGGSFDFATWTETGGTPTTFDFIYCVDFFNHISLNGIYGNAAATSTGVVNGTTIHNAEQVAWLLDTYGTGGNGVQAYALQAAIWHVIYDGSPDAGHLYTIWNISGTSDDAAVELYNTMLLALGSNTSDVSRYLWITPNGTTNNVQGQVASVPEPGTMILLGIGLIGMASFGRKKFRK